MTLLIIAVILYPAVEGLREYFFWIVNKTANFSEKKADMNRKWTCVLTWLAFNYAAGVALGFDWWVLIAFLWMSAQYRHIVHDGVLNSLRDIAWYQVSSSGRDFSGRNSGTKPLATKIVLMISSTLIFLWNFKVFS